MHQHPYFLIAFWLEIVDETSEYCGILKELRLAPSISQELFLDTFSRGKYELEGLYCSW